MVNRLEIGHSAEHMIICVRKGVYSDIINNKEIDTTYGYVWLIRYF